MGIDSPATKKVKAALEKEGLAGRLTVLDETARSAEDAAAALGVAVEAIVKTLIFEFTASDGPFKGQVFPIAALISGDRQCDTKAVSKIMEWKARSAVRMPSGRKILQVTLSAGFRPSRFMKM